MTYTPSVDTTFLPKLSFVKDFYQRADLRARRGRIYNWEYVPFLNDTDFLPPAEGATCFRPASFPTDLGPDVTDAPTALFDLRDDCGSSQVFDLNPLN